MEVFLHWMKSIFKFGGDLNEVVVVEVNLLLALVSRSHVDLSVCEAEVVSGSTIEVPFDGKGLEDEGSLEACTDVDDCIIGQ